MNHMRIGTTNLRGQRARHKGLVIACESPDIPKVLAQPRVNQPATLPLFVCFSVS